MSLPPPYYSEPGITLYHGDCREILPHLPKVDLVLTDPPYGIGYRHGGRRGGRLMGFDGQGIIGDAEPFDPAPFLGSEATVLWGANHYANRLPPSPGWLVWDKRDSSTPNDQSDCELAWTSTLTTARLFSRYWSGGAISEQRMHVNQKPLGLMIWCLRFFPDATTILDPFCGSGTTLIAAKMLGRRAIGIEIEERYCAIAARRLRETTPPLPGLMEPEPEQLTLPKLLNLNELVGD